MLARLRSWWQKTSKTLDAVVILMLVVLIALVVVIILGYANNWNWTGLHGRTLFDWLQLLIIPAVLAVGGYLFNYTTGRNERQANEQRAQTERDAAAKRDQTERDISLDNQREAALQAYIDSMSELLLHEKLRESDKDDEVRTIARVRTLRVLPRLDDGRKLSVLSFLLESDLINKDDPIIVLDGANLSGVNLEGGRLIKVDLGGVDLHGANLQIVNAHEARLFRANLSGADLSYSMLDEADLTEANLSGANLNNTFLRRADLSYADLSYADLTGAKVTDARLEYNTLEGTIMPDGTKHD